MICELCISKVTAIVTALNIPYKNIRVGELLLTTEIGNSEKLILNRKLKTCGLELSDGKLTTILDHIKALLTQHSTGTSNITEINVREFLESNLLVKYANLNDTFASVYGIPIDQYYINKKIDKIKELIAYSELTLTEISYELGYNSVNHLSIQFRRATGLSPSFFKKICSIRALYISTISD